MTGVVQQALPERSREILADAAWPALRERLTRVDAAGDDPVEVLRAVAARRELGTATVGRGSTVVASGRLAQARRITVRGRREYAGTGHGRYGIGSGAVCTDETERPGGRTEQGSWTGPLTEGNDSGDTERGTRSPMRRWRQRRSSPWRYG